MISGFLWKGVLRDRKRTLLPAIVVAIGVFFIVFLDGFIAGMMTNMVNTTANFQTGHLKVISYEYSLEEDQMPLDYALQNISSLKEVLNRDYPQVAWTERIQFGGLLDIPDENGETKAQGPVSATAYNILNPDSGEVQRLGFERAMVSGNIISNEGEILISTDFAENYDVVPGDIVTFFGSTMWGSMTFMNYTVAGIIRFGVEMLDKGAIIMDIKDAEQLLDMYDAATGIYGYFRDDLYHREEAELIKNAFNESYFISSEPLSPLMLQLADQNMMSQTLAYVDTITLVTILLLVLALSIVLWNTGLMGGIRRYNEFGIRLALGETKGHIFRSLMTESFFIALIGSVTGTLLGLVLCLYIAKEGIDYSAMMESISMMIDPVLRAEVKPRLFYIGFIPGVLSMLAGSALAGRSIYKRETSMLFKELE